MGRGFLASVVEHAHKFFFKEETVESSKYRELLGVFRCV
jgi:hypothetical protein